MLYATTCFMLWNHSNWALVLTTLKVYSSTPHLLSGRINVVVVQCDTDGIIMRLLILAAVWPEINFNKTSLKAEPKCWALCVGLSASPGSTAVSSSEDWERPNAGTLTSNNNIHERVIKEMSLLANAEAAEANVSRSLPSSFFLLPLLLLPRRVVKVHW